VHLGESGPIRGCRVGRALRRTPVHLRLHWTLGQDLLVLDPTPVALQGGAGRRGHLEGGLCLRAILHHAGERDDDRCSDAHGIAVRDLHGGPLGCGGLDGRELAGDLRLFAVLRGGDAGVGVRGGIGQPLAVRPRCLVAGNGPRDLPAIVAGERELGDAGREHRHLHRIVRRNVLGTERRCSRDPHIAARNSRWCGRRCACRSSRRAPLALGRRRQLGRGNRRLLDLLAGRDRDHDDLRCSGRTGRRRQRKGSNQSRQPESSSAEQTERASTHRASPLHLPAVSRAPGPSGIGPGYHGSGWP